MENKTLEERALQQSIDKTVERLGGFTLPYDMPEFEKYQVMLDYYVDKYKVVIGYSEPYHPDSYNNKEKLE